MSYHIYTTKGLVLSSRAWRESDRIYNILTRDLGLIRATAIGVRKEVSKLRGSLEPISLSRVSLVRGKEFWRVTSSEFLEKVEPKPETIRPLALLEKLVQGEDPHAELFDVIEKALLNPEPDPQMFETRLVAEILFHLGYLKEIDLTLDKKALVKAINEGLQESQLST